jgi:hypothetical protein
LGPGFSSAETKELPREKLGTWSKKVCKTVIIDFSIANEPSTVLLVLNSRRYRSKRRAGFKCIDI